MDSPHDSADRYARDNYGSHAGKKAGERRFDAKGHEKDEPSEPRIHQQPHMRKVPPAQRPKSQPLEKKSAKQQSAPHSARSDSKRNRARHAPPAAEGQPQASRPLETQQRQSGHVRRSQLARGKEENNSIALQKRSLSEPGAASNRNRKNGEGKPARNHGKGRTTRRSSRAGRASKAANRAARTRTSVPKMGAGAPFSPGTRTSKAKSAWKPLYSTKGTARQKGPDASIYSDKGPNAWQKAARFLAAVGGVVVSAAAFAVHAVATACRRSKPVFAAVVLAAIIVACGAFDSASHLGKVYGHVMVGDIDASGMTERELSDALLNRYGTSLAASGVTVYASEEAMRDHVQSQDSGNLSVDQQADQTTSWYADKNSLQAYIDYNDLVEEAMKAGRKGFGDRVKLFFSKRNIDVSVNYNEAIIESLASQMDAVLGYPYVNSEVTVANGNATASESSQGMMVDRSELKSKLTDQFLNAGAENREFVETAVETPPAIDTQKGQDAAALVNAVIANGASFSYDGTSWSVDSTTLGSWISTNIITDAAGEKSLSVYFDPQKARADLAEHAKASFPEGGETVKFQKDEGGDVKVLLGAEGTMPQLNAAVSKLNDALLGTGANDSAAPSIEIESVDVPSEMYLTEALHSGVVSSISEYTTEYTTGAAERNHNIHLAADLLNNSIIEANGGEWSFNEIAGECNEEKGFQPAGSIVNGEVTDEIGGGICQVGTTVFNAVYELGVPVLERHNHSVYISSYPAGRDAAINWPDQDLRWQNDTASDMLLSTSYTDGSLTVTIYGVDPHYSVSTETGEWEAGSKYTTTYLYDDTLAAGYSYVKTSGSDGRSITVTRTVTDAQGNQLRQDVFESNYVPTDEVIVRGGTEKDWD